VRLILEPAYVLHAWPYRETSLLLDVFTRDQGRIGVLAKGVKKPKSLAKSLLQPFVPLLLSCAGKTDLLLLQAVELREPVYFLKGRHLLCALYMNELCVRLMHRFDPNTALFEHYEQALAGLLALESEQKVLRIFEKSLLQALGYALPLGGDMLIPEAWYHFDPERGPLLQTPLPSSSPQSQSLFRGSTLLAFAHERLEDSGVLSEIKRLMKQVLALYLGPKPLQTRALL
jgi:DNA repair protein RecO (recombination protein O)